MLFLSSSTRSAIQEHSWLTKDDVKCAYGTTPIQKTNKPERDAVSA
jgi:hypothetical protein